MVLNNRRVLDWQLMGSTVCVEDSLQPELMSRYCDIGPYSLLCN